MFFRSPVAAIGMVDCQETYSNDISFQGTGFARLGNDF